MSRRECSRALEISQAVQSGGSLEAHREHLEGCPICRETVTVTSWLRGVAAATERRARVPASESIWWRAQVVRKLSDLEELESRRARPLALVHIAGAALAVVTLLAGIFLGGAAPVSGLVEGVTSLLGDAGAAILAIAALASAVTGAFVAWQASQQLG